LAIFKTIFFGKLVVAYFFELPCITAYNSTVYAQQCTQNFSTLHCCYYIRVLEACTSNVAAVTVVDKMTSLSSPHLG